MRTGFRQNLPAGLTGRVGLVGLVMAAAIAAGLACGTSATPAEGELPPEPAATLTETLPETLLETLPETPGAESPPPAPVVARTPPAVPTGAPATSPPAAPGPALDATASPEGATSAIPTPTRAPTQPPADWERELRTAGIYRGDWKTDFSQRSVPYTEIFSGGVPRDGIPPLDQPNFTTVAQADGWLEAQEPVIAFELNGEAKAYPLQILTWHEIANDTVGGVPVVATFCPLCNSAIVFDRRLEGKVYDFGVSGNLRNSDLIMWDRQTESWWQQLTGEAIVGELTGKRLALLPATIVAWEDFKTSYPDAAVLSRDTGFSRDYGRNPYVGYDQVGQSPFLFFGREDDRLPPTERVAALTVGETAAAFPFSFLETKGVVHHSVGGRDLAVFFKPGARSALDGPYIGASKEVGATGVFARELDGQLLTFRTAGDESAGFIDAETGSQWNILGQATAGPLSGKQLTPLVHANHFWFAWAAFRPDTEVVREAS